MAKQKILKFPAGFLWGVSTSSYQYEGGNVNDWSEWEKSKARLSELKKQGKNPDDYISGPACDSYNRYEEDLALVKNLHCNAYRLSLEWSRLEPEPGQWNMAEIEHYRKVLQAAKADGLKISLTLWHYTLPLWLARQGGWTDKNVSQYFSRYTELIVKELGQYVDYWATFNEPFVVLGFGYLTGKFPPNRKLALLNALKVTRNFLKAHKQAYNIIHGAIPAAQVSLTFLTAYVEPANIWNPIEWAIAKIINYFRNDYFFKRVNGYFDYIGVDYYHHLRIVWYPPFVKNKNKLLSDFGWEIYPEGIYHVLMDYKKFKKPIIILENGVADARDKFRSDFITEHLRWVHRAISEGVEVLGYFHWSLLDNFEWADGYAMKFGLYEVDRQTFKRTARPSAELYAQICKNSEVIVD